MFRRAKDAKPHINLPDVLGYITGGVRVDLGPVQCALAVNPRKVPAGQNFETLLLIQNLLDADVDVGVRLLLPAQDSAGNRGVFMANADRLLVGLEPAEVGVVVLPLTCSPLTQPSEKKEFKLMSLAEMQSAERSDYRLGVDLKVKQKGRGDQVRDPSDAIPFDPLDADMDEALVARLEELKGVSYNDEQPRRDRLVAGFDVLEPAGPSLGLDLKPSWQSLWTKSDHIDEAVVMREVEGEAQAKLLDLNRGSVFKLLLQRVQFSFTNAGYPLQTGEALFVAKLLTMVVENGATLAPELPPSRWYVRMCRLIYSGERAVQNTKILVGELVWREIVVDAVTLGFNMVSTIAHQSLPAVLSHIFGRKIKPAEADALVRTYAYELAKVLSLPEPAETQLISFADAYMPLVLGGLVANNIVTMPGESALDSIHLFKRNSDSRMTEKTEANAYVFPIVEQLLKRGFDMLA